MKIEGYVIVKPEDGYETLWNGDAEDKPVLLYGGRAGIEECVDPGETLCAVVPVADLPATITTAEERDALPVGSVIRTNGSAVYQRGIDGCWYAPKDGSRWTPGWPATVLYRPDQP